MSEFREQHIARHKELHKEFDVLLADFIWHTGKRPSETPIIELLNWSCNQTIDPDEE